MSEIKERLKNVTASGSAGGDMVTVTMNGAMEVVNIKIDPIAVDPRDVNMLEQLLQSAFAMAQVKIKEEIGTEFSPLGMDFMKGVNL